MGDAPMMLRSSSPKEVLGDEDSPVGFSIRPRTPGLGPKVDHVSQTRARLGTLGHVITSLQVLATAPGCVRTAGATRLSRSLDYHSSPRSVARAS